MALRHFQLNQLAAQPAIGYVLITGGGTADGDQVGVAGRLYEFDTNAAIAGQVAVDVSGGANAAQSITALVAAINGDAQRVVDALDGGGNVCVLVHRTPGTGGNVALTNPVDGGGTIDISAATLVLGAAEGRLSLVPFARTITAQDVAALVLALGTAQVPLCAFPSTTQPQLFSSHARSATGADIALVDGQFTFQQINANQWVLLYNEPVAGALLGANNVITGLIGVSGV